MAMSRALMIICVLPAIIGFILILAASAEKNVLFSGETLGTDERLTNGEAFFIIQGDCNLVLYYGKQFFQSNTAGHGRDCTLTLTNKGQFVIKNGNGATVWTRPLTPSNEGKYAAVLRPDRVVSIYGPQVWSTPDPNPAPTRTIKNVLLSGETLGTDERLTYDGAFFIIQGDCNLVLYYGKEFFQSNTAGHGRNCTLTLNNKGQFIIKNSYGNTVWTKPITPSNQEGKYAALLRPDRVVAIYGPQVWSTPDSTLSLSTADSDVKVV